MAKERNGKSRHVSALRKLEQVAKLVEETPPGGMPDTAYGLREMLTRVLLDVRGCMLRVGARAARGISIVQSLQRVRAALSRQIRPHGRLRLR